MDWKIRNVHYTTKENIKKLAKQSQVSVGEFLNAQFGSVEPNTPEGRTWRVKNIKPNVVARIKHGAARHKLSIPEYLEFLADTEPPNIDRDQLEDLYNKLGAEIKKIVDNPK